MPSAASRYGIFATDAAGRVNPVAVAPVHRIGAWRERLALPPAVRRVAGRLPVHDVRRDGQDRLRVQRRSGTSDASAACS